MPCFIPLLQSPSQSAPDRKQYLPYPLISSSMKQPEQRSPDWQKYSPQPLFMLSSISPSQRSPFLQQMRYLLLPKSVFSTSSYSLSYSSELFVWSSAATISTISYYYIGWSAFRGLFCCETVSVVLGQVMSWLLACEASAAGGWGARVGSGCPLVKQVRQSILLFLKNSCANSSNDSSPISSLICRISLSSMASPSSDINLSMRSLVGSCSCSQMLLFMFISIQFIQFVGNERTSLSERSEGQGGSESGKWVWNNLNHFEHVCLSRTFLLQRPSEPIRFLVGRNLDQLVKLAITEATQFQHTSQTKSKALDQLKYALLIGEDRITRHTETIVKALMKISQLDQVHEIPGCAVKVRQIVEIIGFYVKSDYYIPLIVSILGQEDIKNSGKNTIALLNILGHMLLRSQGLESHLDLLTSTLAAYETQFIENDEGLTALFDITSTLLRRLGAISDKFLHVAFQICTDIQATKSIPEAKRAETFGVLELLAAKGGFATVAELHAAEIGPILEKMLKSKEYTSWNRTSKNRFKFDTIVRNCHSEVRRFLQQILQVFEFLINSQNDLETRMDTLVLIEQVLSLPDLREALAPLSEQLLKKVLVAAIQWKVGKPQIKIRKAGVINIISLIERQIISEDQLLDCLKDLLPHLKNCLNDDWAPELRLASCQLLEKYLLATKQKIGDDELKELYPMLLERLDDSQDPIRIKIATAINVFFSCRYIKLSESTLEYVINAIFVHFDDSSQDIRSAIFLSLKHAALVDPREVLKHAQNNLKRMKNRDRCEELIEYCQQRIEDFGL